jgi:hypothetical protein
MFATKGLLLAHGVGRNYQIQLKNWRVLREAMAAMSLVAMWRDKEIVCRRE